MSLRSNEFASLFEWPNPSLVYYQGVSVKRKCQRLLRYNLHSSSQRPTSHRTSEYEGHSIEPEPSINTERWLAGGLDSYVRPLWTVWRETVCTVPAVMILIGDTQQHSSCLKDSRLMTTLDRRSGCYLDSSQTSGRMSSGAAIWKCSARGLQFMS